MSIESDLRKDGIKVVKKVDTLKVNSIAINVSIKLCETFPEFNLNQTQLFERLSKIHMYYADMPEGMSEASYLFKNSSIYFNSHVEEDKIEEFAIHECIHHLQEIKDKRNYLLRMGLCDYTEFKVYGLALNEAAVQLMTSKILGTPREYTKYFGISFETNSPSCYPLECCLVDELTYIVGEDVLFDSTLNSNDKFKEKLVNKIGYKNFIDIENLLDKILSTEEKIIKLNNKIFTIDDRNKKVDHIIEKINELKKEIATLFIKTQNTIISSYFDRQFDLINSFEGIEEYRKNLYNFRDYLGATEGYTYFNDYYVDKMVKLEEKYNLLENGSEEIYMVVKRQSKFSIILKFIRNLILKEDSKEYSTNENYTNDK